MPDQVKERFNFHPSLHGEYPQFMRGQPRREIELETTSRFPRKAQLEALNTTPALEAEKAASVPSPRRQVSINHRRVYPILIAVAILGAVLLFAYGLVLIGYVLAGLILAVTAQLYGAESQRPPFSKEEELALSKVQWELDDPMPSDDQTTNQATSRDHRNLNKSRS